MHVEGGSDNEFKSKFFAAIKNVNDKELIAYFRNEKYKPWLYKEEDEYTGKKIIKNSTP
jgi:hypothetical protein